MFCVDLGSEIEVNNGVELYIILCCNFLVDVVHFGVAGGYRFNLDKYNIKHVCFQKSYGE